MLDLTKIGLTQMMAARLAWLGSLAGQVSFAAIAYYSIGPLTNEKSVPVGVLALISIILLSVAWRLRYRLESPQESDPRVPPRVAAKPLPGRFIAGLVCTELVGVVGVAAHLLGHPPSTAMSFFVVSIVAALLHYPRARDLQW